MIKNLYCKKVFKLLSMATMVASITTPLMATSCSNDNFSFDLNEVETNQMFGYTTTYDIHPTHDIKEIEFAYTVSSVVEASWEDNKLVITPKRPGYTTLIIIAKDNDGNKVVKNINFDVDSKIHEFINERTLSLRYKYYSEIEEGEGGYWNIGGTGWLFYHETDPNKKKSEYTYYLLTNNHVAGGFQEFLEECKEKYPDELRIISFAYQDWDEAKSTTSTFSFDSDGASGSSCVYNRLIESWNNTTDEKFCTLFTSYIRSNYGDGVARDYYRDFDICKIDLSYYANTPFGKNRLDKLNEYADKHDNKLLEFDDYSDLTSDSDVKSIYTGGFPIKYADAGAGTIYPDWFLKYQSQIFNDATPNIYDDMNTMLQDYFFHSWDDKGKTEQKKLIINTADGQKVDAWRVTVSDWFGQGYTQKKTMFGHGASGSLGLTASDPLNPDTYKASGIYWGRDCNEAPIWTSWARFTPFTLNFGKNLPSGDTEWNIINRFYNSAAFTTNTPTNDFCYTFTV